MRCLHGWSALGDYIRRMPQVFDGESHPDEILSAVGAQLATVDADVSPFRLRNRYRGGVGTWIVSIAVPAGHAYLPDKLAFAAGALGIRIEGYFEYTGDLGNAIRNDLGEPPTRDGLPLTNEDQSCGFCDDEGPTWVHPLDEAKVRIRVGEENFTLPTFWTICRRCEELLTEGRDSDLARIFHHHEADSLNEASRVVEVFRAADLGARPITHISSPD